MQQALFKSSDYDFLGALLEARDSYDIEDTTQQSQIEWFLGDDIHKDGDEEEEEHDIQYDNIRSASIQSFNSSGDVSDNFRRSRDNEVHGVSRLLSQTSIQSSSSGTSYRYRRMNDDRKMSEERNFNLSSSQHTEINSETDEALLIRCQQISLQVSSMVETIEQRQRDRTNHSIAGIDIKKVFPV